MARKRTNTASNQPLFCYSPLFHILDDTWFGLLAGPRLGELKWEDMQILTKVGVPGLVNFITAVLLITCKSLPAAFTQPGASTKANLCTLCLCNWCRQFQILQSFHAHTYIPLLSKALLRAGRLAEKAPDSKIKCSSLGIVECAFLVIRNVCLWHKW